MSDAYTNRMAESIWQAIVETGKAEGGECAVLLSGEIVKALLLNLSFVASTSETTSTPQKRREFCAAAAKKLRGYLDASRVEFEKGAMDFITVRPSAMH